MNVLKIVVLMFKVQFYTDALDGAQTFRVSVNLRSLFSSTAKINNDLFYTKICLNVAYMYFSGHVLRQEVKHFYCHVKGK